MQLRGLWMAVAVLGAASPGHADDTIARADQLFQEGRALVDTDLTAACARFEASLRLNSQAIGTLLNVALCDQKLGRLASAHAKFSEARDRAAEQRLAEHLAAAQRHLDELAPRLPHVTLRFAAAPLPGTKIVVHDRVVPLSAIEDLPLDPGEHIVVVSAPGHVAYQSTLTIREAERRTFEIPPLAPAVTVTSSRRTIGKVTAITGAGVFGASVAIAMLAQRRYSTAVADCTEAPGGMLECDTAGFKDARNAQTLGNVGTAVGAVGLIAAGVGTFLWLTGPRSSSESSPEVSARRITIVPQLDSTGGGITAVGRF